MQSCIAFSPIVPQRDSFQSVITEQNAATALSFDTSVAPPPQEAEESKVGVLLLNLGGPEKSEDVEGEKQNSATFSLQHNEVLRSHLASYIICPCIL